MWHIAIILLRQADYPILLQRSFFFFARRSCSEQSTFHGQASDRVWFFSELLFQSVKKEKKKKIISSELWGLADNSRRSVNFPKNSRKKFNKFRNREIHFLLLPNLAEAIQDRESLSLGAFGPWRPLHHFRTRSRSRAGSRPSGSPLTTRRAAWRNESCAAGQGHCSSSPRARSALEVASPTPEYVFLSKEDNLGVSRSIR